MPNVQHVFELVSTYTKYVYMHEICQLVEVVT